MNEGGGDIDNQRVEYVSVREINARNAVLEVLAVLCKLN